MRFPPATHQRPTRDPPEGALAEGLSPSRTGSCGRALMNGLSRTGSRGQALADAPSTRNPPTRDPPNPPATHLEGLSWMRLSQNSCRRLLPTFSRGRPLVGRLSRTDSLGSSLASVVGCVPGCRPIWVSLPIESTTMVCHTWDDKNKTGPHRYQRRWISICLECCETCVCVNIYKNCPNSYSAYANPHHLCAQQRNGGWTQLFSIIVKYYSRGNFIS